jgi:hypothetical protein
LRRIGYTEYSVIGPFTESISLTNEKLDIIIEPLYTREEGGIMELWPAIMWFLVVIVTVFRVAMVFGALALIWYIIKGVRERALV